MKIVVYYSIETEHDFNIVIKSLGYCQDISDMDAPSIISTTIVSFVFGSILGLVTTKLSKLVPFLLGTNIAIISYFVYTDYISINWSTIETDISVIGSVVTVIQQGTGQELYETSGMLLGFVIGFVVGYYKL